MISIDTSEASRTQPLLLSSIIGAIGHVLSAAWFPHVHRSNLKRLGLSSRSAGEIAGLRVLIDAGAAVEAMNPAEMRNWIFLVHCMAVMSAPDRDPHSTSNGAKPGFVLHRIGYGETWLGRLLESQGPAFETLLERAASRMARAGVAVNWSKIAPLVLSTEPRSSWAENARIAISRDFMIATATNLSKKTKTTATADTPAIGQTF